MKIWKTCLSLTAACALTLALLTGCSGTTATPSASGSSAGGKGVFYLPRLMIRARAIKSAPSCIAS